jgi:hypothetical protein
MSAGYTGRLWTIAVLGGICLLPDYAHACTSTRIANGLSVTVCTDPFPPAGAPVPSGQPAAIAPDKIANVIGSAADIAKPSNSRIFPEAANGAQFASLSPSAGGTTAQAGTMQCRQELDGLVSICEEALAEAGK